VFASTSRHAIEHIFSVGRGGQGCGGRLIGTGGHRYGIHDRDTILSPKVDEAVIGVGLKVLTIPIPTPVSEAHHPGARL
jgi:hypothetical protein